MTKFPIALAAAAALLVGTAATAQIAPTARTPAMAANTTTHSRTGLAANGRMVSTRTSTGKAVTYNCSKAGNASKKACK